MGNEAQSHLERARRAYEAAKLLVERGLLEDAFSRAYYAVAHFFYALLLNHDETIPRTHSGLVAKLWALKEALNLTPAEVRQLSRFQSLRENSDYASIPAVDRKDVEELLEYITVISKKLGVQLD